MHIMYKATLDKIKNGEALRTSTVSGHALEFPEVGKSFRLVADAIVPGAEARFVITSEVQRIEQEDTSYVLYTLNSVYRVTIEDLGA